MTVVTALSAHFHLSYGLSDGVNDSVI